MHFYSEGVPRERWILTSLWKTAWPNSSSRPSGFERPMKHRISVTNEGKLVVTIKLKRAWTRILEKLRKIQRSHGTPSVVLGLQTTKASEGLFDNIMGQGGVISLSMWKHAPANEKRQAAHMDIFPFWHQIRLPPAWISTSACFKFSND